MNSSNHTQDPPLLPQTPAPKRRAYRRALPPPGETQPLVPHILQEGDDPAAFFNLRARASQLSGEATDFSGFLADLLAAQAYEFCRCETMRSAALHLQVEDDRTGIDASFREVDDPTRQVLSYRKLTAQKFIQDIGKDSDRYFRRMRQCQAGIQKAIVGRVR